MNFAENHPITTFNQLIVSGFELLNNDLWDRFNEVLRYPVQTEFLSDIRRGINDNDRIITELKEMTRDGMVPDWSEILRGLTDVAKYFLLHGENSRIIAQPNTTVDFINRPADYFQTFERVAVLYQPDVLPVTPPAAPVFRAYSPNRSPRISPNHSARSPRFSPWRAQNRSPRQSPNTTPSIQHSGNQRRRRLDSPYPAAPQQVPGVIAISDDSDEENWSVSTTIAHF